MQALKQAPSGTPEARERVRLLPDAVESVAGSGRAIAVDHIRAIADALEAGEIDGVGFYWRDDHGENTCMEINNVRHVGYDGGPGFVRRKVISIEESEG